MFFLTFSLPTPDKLWLKVMAKGNKGKAFLGFALTLAVASVVFVVVDKAETRNKFQSSVDRDVSRMSKKLDSGQTEIKTWR